MISPTWSLWSTEPELHQRKSSEESLAYAVIIQAVLDFTASYEKHKHKASIHIDTEAIDFLCGYTATSRFWLSAAKIKPMLETDPETMYNEIKNAYKELDYRFKSKAPTKKDLGIQYKKSTTTKRKRRKDIDNERSCEQ